MMELESSYSRHVDIYIGAHHYAEQAGWEIIIDEFADHRLAELRGGEPPYDGVIARSNETLMKHAKAIGLPVVNAWLNSPVADELPGVFPDFFEVGRLRGEHLISRGVTRFITLTADTVGHRMEVEGFRHALAEKNYPCEHIEVTNDVSHTIEQWHGIEKAMDRALAQLQPPVGIFAGHEMVGRLVAQRCRSFGLAVPQDVAIMTGCNESAFVEQPRPSLTSIDLDSEQVGYEAARMLHGLMDGRAPHTEKVFTPPAGVVVRESTDFHVVADADVEAALKYIAENFHRRIGPDDVAREVRLQTRTLQNRFRKALGWPVATEIRRVRVERAKRALAQSDRLVADIAEEVGYPDPMRLYEVFRREVGMSPSAFRKQRQNPPGLDGARAAGPSRASHAHE